MMARSTSRFTAAATTAALLSFTGSAAAQSTGSTQPPDQPPALSSQAPTASPQVDAQAAKAHLSAARDTLSQMTQLPEAAQLTGDARTQVSELISNFNALITTTVDWPSAYAKVEGNLNTLLGPEGSVDEPRPGSSGTEGAVGTAGTTAALPANVKAKLIEFRNHLEQFEQASGGPRSASADSASGTAATPSPSPAGPSSSPAPEPAPGTTASSSVPAASSINRDEALQHVQAIEALLGSGSSSPASAEPSASAEGAPITLDAARMQQLRSHLAELKRILGQQ